jgi:hypothetical protein
VQPIYWGHDWTGFNATMNHERQKLDSFLADMVRSPLMDAMSEYYMTDASGKQVHVGKGSFLPSTVVDAVFRTDSTGRQIVDDNDIQSMLTYEIDNGYVNRGALYMVFTPDNVVVVNNGTTTPANELAHHTSYNDPWYGATPYAIVPNPIGNPATYWNATTTDLQKLTGNASHEFEEAVTDPLGNAWYDASPPAAVITEIGDYTTYYKPSSSPAGLQQKGTAGVFGQDQQYSLLNGYVVQNVWSVKANNTVALPQTPPDLVGTTFNLSYGSSTTVSAVVSIRWEDPTTGAFSGLYHDFFGWIPISGQLSGTTTSSGIMTTQITFSGSGYNYPFLQSVGFSGRVTGNGNATTSGSDLMSGTLEDFVYYVPNHYQFWAIIGGPNYGGYDWQG